MQGQDSRVKTNTIWRLLKLPKQSMCIHILPFFILDPMPMPNPIANPMYECAYPSFPNHAKIKLAYAPIDYPPQITIIPIS
ncbi:hypothetical protein EYC84_004647 [Monilinia fructicola]|uniref:Uncharacterized protein n=1 Tax=Monilinia fructicola TaxID=38448 RepID=A0A5M9K127_MONFR|nr:hypothetical protein EYC84_004647 [Monilinia fructicola]